MRHAIPLLALFLLSGCGVGPGLTGNDTGGIIPYANYDRVAAT